MTAGPDDALYLRRALELARRGEGRTAPNPPVGCVIARDRTTLAEGWHRRAGDAHAEVEALRQLGGRADGATAYVTLEPCNHTGRTGPCTEALIAAGVARVVVGTLDPNPRVRGGGLSRLREAGIATLAGVEEEACRRLVAPFATWVTKGRPLVTLKVASSLDGRIATATGHSRWVTGEAARAEVHRMRDAADAILVGSGTVRADDPELTCRIPGGRDPLRVVLASNLDLPPAAHVLSGAAPTVVVTAAGDDRVAALRDRGVEVWTVGAGPGGVALDEVMTALAARDVMSLLVEGGRRVATAFLAEGLVDRVACFLAPKIVGDDGLPWAGPLGFPTMDQALTLEHVTVRRFGEDLCVEGDCVHGNR